MHEVVHCVWRPCSTFGKQAIHFSETRVSRLKLVFL